MSFSFSYVAKTRESAKSVAQSKVNSYTPQAVADVVALYVDNLSGGVPEESFIHVTVNGHWPNPAHDYDRSGTFAVNVNVLDVTE